MSKHFWIGCDMGKYSFGVALASSEERDMDWTKLPHGEFEHSEEGVKTFLAWIKDMGVDRNDIDGVCLESTGRLSRQWAVLLNGEVGAVSIVNPAQPKAFRESLGIRDKSDRVDACVCALFGRMRQPKPTTFRSPKCQELCDQFRCYLNLSTQRIANEQRLNDGPTAKAVRDSLSESIDFFKAQIAALEAAMAQTIKADPQLREDAALAQTVRGIGKKATAIILGEFGDLRQYSRNELAALSGLFPKQHSSGTSVWKKPHLVKGGGGQVRQILYMCAMAARRYNPHMKRFADRLEARGKKPMEVLGAIMRKLLLQVRAVIVSGKAYDPNYGLGVESEAV